jgi:hypothetical protein
VLGGIAWQESIGGQVAGLWPDAATVVSGDGGRGLCQLTSSFPDDWTNPAVNATYALDAFLLGAVQYWNVHVGLTGTDLLRAIAAEFNAGRSGAEQGHVEGDVGNHTTHDANGVSYPDNVLAHYTKLIVGEQP